MTASCQKMKTKGRRTCELLGYEGDIAPLVIGKSARLRQTSTMDLISTSAAHTPN